jgi:hypothetical protein
MAALDAGNDRVLSRGTTAVGAEMRPPEERRSTLAMPSGVAARSRRREHRVELVQAGFEPDDLLAVLEQQVFAQLVPPVHLEHQPAQIPNQLLPGADDRTALPAERARRGSAAHEARATLGTAPHAEARQPEARHGVGF